MKTNLSFKNIKLGGVELGEFNINAEFSISELRGVKNIVKETIKELPEILEDLKVGALKHEEINEQFEKLDDINMREQALKRDVRKGKLSAEMADKMINDFGKREVIENLKYRESSEDTTHYKGVLGVLDTPEFKALLEEVDNVKRARQANKEAYAEALRDVEVNSLDLEKWW